MAKKRSGKKPDKRDQKEKSFWSKFFEPVPEEEDGFFDARREEQESEPPMHLFSEDEPDFSEEQDRAEASRLRWDDGQPVVDVPGVAHTDGPLPDDEEEETPAAQDAAPIHLFDDEDTGSFTRQETNRTRIFKTGQTTTTRIHINNTEEAQRRDEAERLARQREAKRRREEKLERENRKKKRRAAMVKLFGNIAFVILIFVGILVALYYTFLLSDIIVVGNDTYSTDYIIELSGLKLGRHMLLCDLDGAETNIAEDPYLQVDSVTYIFPSRVRIMITERKEVAGIIGLDYNVIIDKNGYVLSMSGGTDLTGLIQVTGVSMTGFQLGQRLGQGDDFSTASLVNIIAALEQYDLLDTVYSIDLTTPLAITMTTQQGLTVFIGQPIDLNAKMTSLSELLPQFVAQNISYGTLYLSAKGGTVFSPTSDSARSAISTGETTTEDDSTAPLPSTTPSAGGDDPFSG